MRFVMFFVCLLHAQHMLLASFPVQDPSQELMQSDILKSVAAALKQTSSPERGIML